MTLNIRFSRWFLAVLALLAAFALGVWSVDALNPEQPSAVSFGTGFTYQGFLRDNSGNPLTDTCDFTFRLYDDLTVGNKVGGDDVISGVSVTDGLFTVVVNEGDEFGPAGTNGGGRFLDITVQCSGDSSPTTLSPRQPINPVPYARFAERFAGYENLIMVAKQGGDFATVTEALAAIGVDTVYPAASDTNRYLIYVAPGIYKDEKIQMKEYVDIEGAGQGITILTATGGADGIKPESATLIGASNAELRYLTVENISDAPSNWAFAIYTATNTSFSHITARASGGSNPRGMMVHDSGIAFMKDVALIASGGSASNTALDVYQASALADTLFVNASGGTDAHGLYINDASSTVKLENVTSFTSGGTNQTNGMYVNQSEVILTTYDTTVSSSGTLVRGITCANLGSRLTASGISVTGANDSDGTSIIGILASNCDLTLRDAGVSVSGSTPVYGLYFSSTITDTKRLEVNQLDIQAHSSASIVNGIYLYSTSETGGSGQLNNINIQASGSLTTSNSYGIYHRANGPYQYQDLAIDISGQATFLYGIKTSNGAPTFQNVIIDAYGEAEVTVFGIEFINPTTGAGVDNGRVSVQNAAGNDAVGLKSSTPYPTVFRNIATDVVASVGVWGFDFVGSIVSASNVEALVEGNADGASLRGIRCQGGSADIHNARLTVQPSTPAITPTVSYGIYNSDCDLILSSSQVRVQDSSGSNYGLFATANSGAPPYFVRDSYLGGSTSTLRTSGYADVVVVNTQLDGGSTSSLSANDNMTCTAVSYGSGTTFNFTAGPVDCP